MAEVTVTKKEPKAVEPFGWFNFEAPFMRSGLSGVHPFNWMKHFTEEMDRAFKTMREPEGMWRPAIEVKEEKGKMRVTAELAGLKPEDVKVHFTGDALVVEGERKFEKEEKKSGYFHTERSYGRFYRAIPMPEGADAEHATANFRDGMLEVMVPIPEVKATTREIPVTHGEPSKAETAP